MDKRKLSKVPRPVATPEMMARAATLKGNHYLVTTEQVQEGSILAVNFFLAERLANGQTGADLRLFMAKDDYITQNLKTDKVRWLEASLRNMQGMLFFVSTWNSKTRSYDSEYRMHIMEMADLQHMKTFLEDYIDADDPHEPWAALNCYQEAIMKERLAARHKRETDIIDEKMEFVGEVPYEFEHWVWNEGMAFSRYLVYKENEIFKGHTDCECSWCRRKGLVPRKDIRLRNNEKANCPFCGTEVVCKARGRLANNTTDRRFFTYVEPTIEGFLMRYFEASNAIYNIYNGGGHKNFSVRGMYECARVFYSFPQGIAKREVYEWNVYKQRGLPRWCPDQGSIGFLECVIYPKNLPAAWAYTPMKYSGLEIIAEQHPMEPMHYETAMRWYRQFPKMEWLCKMGLHKLVRYLSGRRYFNDSTVGEIKTDGGTIYEILGLSKENTKLLQEVNGDEYTLRLLQTAQKMGKRFSAEQLRIYRDAFKSDPTVLREAGRKVTLHKLLKYIDKESKRYPVLSKNYRWPLVTEDPEMARRRNMAKDWKDYLTWCMEMGYDTDNMFIYMPTNFKAVHDRTANEYLAYKDEKAAKEKQLRNILVNSQIERTQLTLKKIFDKNGEFFTGKSKKFFIRLPNGADEIKEEGTILHHCVGTYIDKVAKGKTNILFLRETIRPDVPYFTIELNEGKIIQCRGIRNCDMPDDVKRFVNSFERKLQEQIFEDEKLGRCG